MWFLGMSMYLIFVVWIEFLGCLILYIYCDFYIEEGELKGIVML